MAESKPIPVRIGEEMIQRLDRAALDIGSNRAAIIRMLITKWLDAYEQHGSTVLPPEWRTIMNELDGRRKEAKPRPKQGS